MTWRRDWLNMIWALKSYYHFSGVNYPLYIHDGGLAPGQAEQLRDHFPDARLVESSIADYRTASELQKLGLSRALAYRQRNVTTRKLFDFFVMSTAEHVITIDSDIVFFRRPDALIKPTQGFERNVYNRDASYWYSMTLDEMESAFGIRPPPLINSGLGVIARTSIDFPSIDKWLRHPKLFENTWVTEQTLHALCSTVHGVELLPDTYRVDTVSGFTADTICKHYTGFFRPLLYEEGMTHLIKSGFLDALRMNDRSNF
jgi:hypothetical protein